MRVNKKSLVWVAIAAFVGMATVFTACKDKSVTGVTVNPATYKLAVGEKVQITATVSPSDADDKSVKWNSDKPGIASVDNNGNVTAVAASVAIITCTTNDGGFTAKTEITVVAELIAVTGVTLPGSLELGTGQTRTITPTILPDNATDKSVTWISDKPDIAEVAAEGTVTGKAVGEATITCTANDGGFKATTKVTVLAEVPDYAEKIVGTYVGPLSVGGTDVEPAAKIDVNYIRLNRIELKMDQTLEVGLPVPLPINIACESDVIYSDGKYTIATATVFPLSGSNLNVDITGDFDDDGNVNLNMHVKELSTNVAFKGTKQ